MKVKLFNSLRAGILLLCLSMVSNTFAQERFQRIYPTPGEERVEGGAIYDNNKYLLTARSKSFDPIADHDMAVILLDSIGEVIWSKKLDNGGPEFNGGILVKDEFIYLTGRANNSQSHFIKLDLDGNIILNYRMSHGTQMGIHDIISSGDDIMLAGRVRVVPILTARVDPILIKIDDLGNVVWARRYMLDLPSNELVFDVSEAENGDFLIAGGVNNIGAGSSDFVLLRVNSEGEFLWSKTYGNSEYNVAYKVEETSTNELLICGRYRSGPLSRIGLIKTTSDGDVVWGKSYAHPDNVPYSSVLESSDGNYVIRASCDYGDSHQKAALLKLDTAGNILWTNTYTGKEDFQGTQQFFETQDLGFFIPTGANNGTINLGMIKTDSLGLTACSEDLIVFTEEPIEVIVNAYTMVDTLVTLSRSVGFTAEPISILDTIYCCDSVVANFSYELIDGVYTFTADHMAGATYEWTIGVETYEGEEIIHTFLSTGNSDVCLHVSNYCNSDSTCSEIDIQSVSTEEYEAYGFMFYPNPVSETLSIVMENNDEEFSYAIYSQTGSLIHQSFNVMNKAQYNTSTLEEGIYILRLSSSSGEVTVVKFVKQ